MYRFIIVTFVASVAGQLQLEGACDFNSTVSVNNLNATQLQGDWHILRRIASENETGQCAFSTLSGVTINNGVFSSAQFEIRQVVNKKVITRKADVTAGSGNQLVFKFSDETFTGLVLATDHIGYVLLYGCNNLQNDTRRNVRAWQFSRSDQYTTAQSTAVNAAVNANVDLRNAVWETLGFNKTDCDTSSAVSIASPVILTLVLYNILAKLI
ncbi:unnamed protein product [Pieris brassicae]|uniref:Lipocalin/cytosolic fatty-acid binding domain-containing protein n=1 Tax=Pieris brassicae TaxID=7116 RepID=A0A9P0T6P7_PIEBR|nr:unnamed protein product [Pieris brassicae]